VLITPRRSPKPDERICFVPPDVARGEPRDAREERARYYAARRGMPSVVPRT
jgi:hypothetical protein